MRHAIIVVFLLTSCNSTPPQHRAQSVFLPATPVAAQAPKRAIVFIHGIGGDTRGTWTSPSGTFWLDLARRDSSFRSFDLYSIGYYSPLIDRASDIDEISARFLQIELIDKIFREYDEVHFVAHSMGGLVLKRALVKLRNRANSNLEMAKVGAVLFISTPASGSGLADWASWLSLNPQLRNMQTEAGATYLNSIDSDWRELLRSRPAYRPLPQAFCAYETLPTMGFKVVPRLYSETACDAEPVAFDFNHSQIVKPETTQHPVYRWSSVRILVTSAAIPTFKSPEVRARFISAISALRDLHGEYSLAQADTKVAHLVLRQSDPAITGLTTLDPTTLRTSDRAHRNAFIAMGYLYKAIALDMTSKNNELVKLAATESLRYAGRALDEFSSYKREAEKDENIGRPPYSTWLQWAANENYDQFIYQLMARANLLLFKIGVSDSLANANVAFRHLTPQYVEDQSLRIDYLIKWACATHPREVPICT